MLQEMHVEQESSKMKMVRLVELLWVGLVHRSCVIENQSVWIPFKEWHPIFQDMLLIWNLQNPMKMGVDCLCGTHGVEMKVRIGLKEY